MEWSGPGELDAQEKQKRRGREGAGRAGEATLPLFGQRFCRRGAGPDAWVSQEPRGEVQVAELLRAAAASWALPGGAGQLLEGDLGLDGAAQPSLPETPANVSPSPNTPNPHIRSPPARKSPSPFQTSAAPHHFRALWSGQGRWAGASSRQPAPRFPSLGRPSSFPKFPDQAGPAGWREARARGLPGLASRLRNVQANVRAGGGRGRPRPLTGLGGARSARDGQTDGAGGPEARARGAPQEREQWRGASRGRKWGRGSRGPGERGPILVETGACRPALEEAEVGRSIGGAARLGSARRAPPRPVPRM